MHKVALESLLEQQLHWLCHFIREHTIQHCSSRDRLHQFLHLRRLQRCVLQRDVIRILTNLHDYLIDICHAHMSAELLDWHSKKLRKIRLWVLGWHSDHCVDNLRDTRMHAILQMPSLPRVHLLVSLSLSHRVQVMREVHQKICRSHVQGLQIIKQRHGLVDDWHNRAKRDCFANECRNHLNDEFLEITAMYETLEADMNPVSESVRQWMLHLEDVQCRKATAIECAQRLHTREAENCALGDFENSEATSKSIAVALLNS